MISAPAAPRFPASSMMSATACAGAVITTSSGTNGNWSSRATVAKPSISAWRGLTTPNSPWKFALRILPRMARPTDPCRGLAPTSATDRGNSRFFRR